MLNHKKIFDLIEKRSLVIEPLDFQIGGYTISLRIGTQFLNIGKTKKISSIEIGDSIIIKPSTGISTVSLETIKLPASLSGIINLRSALQRLGLIMNSSFVDPGYIGKITFNLFNISPHPIQLLAGQRTALLALFELESPIGYPTDKYSLQIGPSSSKIYEDQDFSELKNFINQSDEKIKAEPRTETNFGELLHYLLSATNAQEKGKLLEHFMKEAISTIKGLKILKFNARFRAEEIDIIIQNNVSEGFWRTLGSPIVVECKNWTKKVGSKEVSILAEKMKSLSPDVKLGLLVAPNGVSGDWKSDAILKIREKRQQGIYIVVLVKNDLEKIAAGIHTAKVIEKNYERLFLI